MKNKFWKKAAAFVTAAVMSFGTLTVLPEGVLPQVGIAASAEETADSGKCGENLTYTLDSDGTLTIDGQGALYNYQFQDNNSIKKVIVNEGVTQISLQAFKGSSVEEISLPSSVRTLDTQAFWGCHNLKKIDMPEGLETIGDSCFDNCTNIVSLSIPDTVTNIGDRAFWWCTSMETISLSSSMTTIGASAFEYCKSLSDISIPDGITTIKAGAFSDCDSLLKIVLPSTVNCIGDGAFKYCDNLSMIYLPESITQFGSGILYQSTNAVCYGKSNSMAQFYCQKNGYKFVEIDDGAIDDSDNTVHISSAKEWIEMADNNALYDGYKGFTIIIDDDLDFTGINYVPLGNELTPFKGSIEGNGHNILNLKVAATSDNLTYGGLIGYAEVNSNVDIKNINITDYSYNTYQNQEAYGAVLIAGLSIKDGATLNIDNLNLKGTGWAQSTWGNGFYGNVIGTVKAGANTNININNVTTEVRHDGYSMHYGVDAGIVGHYEGTDKTSKLNISRCHVSDDVLAFSYFGYCTADGGGIVGALKNGNAKITECCVNGKLRAKSYYTHIGGIVGNVQASLITINDCIVNPKDLFEKNQVSISAECTNGQAAMGGFIGCIIDSNGSSINNSFFSSTVSAGVKAGFAAWCNENQLVVNNSFFDIDTTGIAKNSGINDTSWIYSTWVNTGLNNSYGITTEQMANQLTYTGWDFNNIWVMTDDGYPQLRWIVDSNTEEKGYIKLSPLNEEGIFVYGGESILAYVYDKDGSRLSNVNLVWISSDEKIVAITNSDNLGAVVEGKLAGEATITCKDTVSGAVGELIIDVRKGVDISKEYDTTDTDGDGLPDVWEKYGITYNGEFLDLPAMGADSNKPDIFVEIDYQKGYDLSGLVDYLKIVCEQFNNHKINLHIDMGASFKDYVTNKQWGSLSASNEIDKNVVIDLYTDSDDKSIPVNTWKTLIDENFNNNSIRSVVFRHCIFGSEIKNSSPKENPDSTTVGFAAGIPNQYFFVAYGAIMNNKYGGKLENKNYDLALTFMHELGHTLGLHHGGYSSNGKYDDTNNKPNYISIMNYLYQKGGLLFYTKEIDENGEENFKENYYLAKGLNYSEYDLPAINENAIDEFLGLDPNGSTKGTHLGAKWCSGDKVYSSFKPIYKEPIDYNWNFIDTQTYERNLKLNLNNDQITYFGDIKQLRFTVEKYSVLADTTNDWNHLIIKTQNIGGNGGALSYYLNKFMTNDVDFSITEEDPNYVPESNHTHEYSSYWQANSSLHWRICDCGLACDIEEHNSDGGTVTTEPTETTVGVKTYKCTKCGYVIKTETIPATGTPSTPTYPTHSSNPSVTAPTPTTSNVTDNFSVKVKKDGRTAILSWDKISNADKYVIYQLKNGKYVKVKTTSGTSVKFKNLTNGKTYKFMVKYIMNGRVYSKGSAGKASVKVYYKPITKATANKNSVKLRWQAVPDAEKYAIYKYFNGKAVKLAETKKLSVNIKGLKSGKKYQYIVRAYVGGKWTEAKKTDIVTVTTK